MKEKPLVVPGLYRHFKGNQYQVMELATHSETGEVVVVYRPLYGERGLWVRPLSLFLQPATVNGQQVPRFQLEVADE